MNMPTDRLDTLGRDPADDPRRATTALSSPAHSSSLCRSIVLALNRIPPCETALASH
jgi:hypothetical protein